MVVINLKRFEFDYNTMQRLKVNDYCEFPERINFRQWTKEGIEQKENNNKEEQEAEQADEELDNDDPESILHAEGVKMDKGLDLEDDEVNGDA